MGRLEMTGGEQRSGNYAAFRLIAVAGRGQAAAIADPGVV
jgi:hypothetical protein